MLPRVTNPSPHFVVLTRLPVQLHLGLKAPSQSRPSCQRLSYLTHVSSLADPEPPDGKLLPSTHRVASLLKRWLFGTHQGAVSHEHVDYDLDKLTFRFNRRTSKTRGLLFDRLAQQAVATSPAHHLLVRAAKQRNHNI